MNKNTITAKEMSDFFKKIAKVTPDAPVYLSSDEEGNSYGTIEKQNNGNFSSFAIMLTPDHKNVQSVVIYPWVEGLTDEEVGLLTQDEIDREKGKI